MLKKEDFEVVEELRGVLQKISGVSSFTEVLSLSYLLQVEKEEDKIAVEKVANLLTEQATKYGIDLEVTAATAQEVEDAKKEYERHVSSKQQSFSFDFSGEEDSD